MSGERVETRYTGGRKVQETVPLPEKDAFAWLVTLLERAESDTGTPLVDPETGCFISPGEMAALVLARHEREVLRKYEIA